MSCADELVEAFGFLDMETAKKIDNEMASLREAFPDRKEFEKAFKSYLETAEHDLKWNYYRVIKDKIKEQGNARSILGEGDFKQASKRLSDFIEGDNSIETHYRKNLAAYEGMFRGALRREGLEDVWMSGTKDPIIRQQMYNIENGLKEVADADVVKISKIIKRVNDRIYDDMVDAGLDVKYRKGYLVPRVHDDVKMRNAGDEAWIDAMLGTTDKPGLLDRAKTFGDTVIKKGEERKVLKKMYEDILETRRIHNAEDQSLVGKKSYINKLRSRKLVFADGMAEHKYAELFGRGNTLSEAFELQMDRAAKTTANINSLGTIPDKGFDAIRNRFEAFFLNKGVDKDEIGRALNRANRAYLNVVANPYSVTTKLDKGVNTIRGFQGFSKLGSSIFMAGYDINATALHYAARSGHSQAEGYMKAFKTFMKVWKMGAEERTRLAQMLETQIWFNDPALVMGANKGDYDTGFHRINKWFKSAYKLTGVPYQTELSRLTNAVIHSENMFNMANKAKLNDFQINTLKTYGITDAELAIMRTIKHGKNEPKVIGGTHILEIDLKKFHSDAGIAKKMQKDLYDKVGKYIDDQVQKGTPTPTSKVRRQLFKGRDVDPKIRAVTSLIMQFKETAWKIALDNMDAFKTFADVGGKGRASKELAMYMTMGFVSYTLIDSMRRAIFNQDSIWDEMESGNPDAMRKLFFDYINKSSLMPVISDAADAATSPYQNSFTKYLAGRSVGMAQDAIDSAKNPSRKSVGKFIKRHVAPGNHFMLKSAERWGFEYDWYTGQKIRK